jgi:hypothetical protein
MAMRSWMMMAMLIFLTACEEAIDRPIAYVDNDLIIVEGVLTNERANHLVKLTRPHAAQNENPEPVSGATVQILAGSNRYTLVEFPGESGHYYTPEFRALTGVTYSLVIQIGEKQFTAQDSAVPVEPLRPLLYRRVNEQFVLTPDDNGRDPHYTTHWLTWKHTNNCQPGEACQAKLIFYNLQNIDVNEIFKPDQEALRFPRFTIVVRKKFSASPAYKEFLRSMLSETQWRGGVFDVQRANVPTNLSAGAIGFFAVSTVVADTTILN